MILSNTKYMQMTYEYAQKQQYFKIIEEYVFVKTAGNRGMKQW